MPTPTNVTLEQILEAQAALTQAGRRVTPSTIRHHIADVYGKSASERTISAMLREAHAPSPPPPTPTPPPAFGYERAPAVQEAPKELPAPDYQQDRQAKFQTAEGDYWRKAYDRLRGEYDKLIQQSAFEEYVAREVIQIAPKSYDPIGKPPARPAFSKSSPESYVLAVSDWHMGEVTTPEQTLGFGEYNPSVAFDRLAFLEESAAHIITDHTISPVEELVVCLLGDMVDGALNHSNEAAQLMTVYEQVYQGSHALAQFLRNLAGIVPRLRVYTAVGNHGRYQSQKKMPTVNRFSNFDQFLYLTTHALVRDIPNIEWQLDKQPFSVFEVQGHVIHAGHGDNIKGGDKALGVPSHAVGRMINTNTQLFYRAQRKAPSIFLMGDKHRRMELPHFNGEVIFNGAFTDVNGYVLASNYAPTEPLQVLFRMHPKYGKTASYNVKLRHARAHQGRAYLEGL